MRVAHGSHFGDDWVNRMSVHLSPQEFVWRADHRRLITRLPAYPLDPGAPLGIGNVPEVPCHQKIDAAGDGNGDMRRIVRGLARNLSLPHT